MRDDEKSFITLFVILLVLTVSWLFFKSYDINTWGIGSLGDLNGSKSLSDPVVRGNKPYLQSNSPNYYEGEVLGSNNHHSERDLIEKYFPSDVWDYAEAVMYCESSGNEKAVNWEYHREGNCSGSFGLFQVSCNNFSGSYKKMFDPEENIKKAAELYERRGFQPWPNCP